MREWTAWIRDSRTGGTFKVVVRAVTVMEARMILEGQYGAGAIFTGPG
jgi:hypothetical protein